MNSARRTSGAAGALFLFSCAVGPWVAACGSDDAAVDTGGDAGSKPVPTGTTTPPSPPATGTGTLPVPPPLPTCTDGQKNGTEADIDCGGTCAACPNGKACAGPADCASGTCSGNLCVAITCADAVKNGTETDIDCGGTCATKCADAKACAVAADCTSGVCTGATKLCAAPSCPDGVKNGNETDLDCGGACATKCAIGKACKVAADCDKALCTGLACRPAQSCKEIKTAVPASPDGVYTLDPDGAGGAVAFQAYCDMTSNGGGWTLALKADGAMTTFGYDAAYWTNADLLNADKPAFDTTEAKLQSFNSIAFTEIRAAITDAAVTRAVVFPMVATSLRALFTGAYAPTVLTPAVWRGLVAAPSMQPLCNREGINADPAGGGFSRVRIGLVGNQENDCLSPDSWLGIGGVNAPCGPGGGETTSVGNVAGCSADNGDINTAGFGYVMVR